MAASDQTIPVDPGQTTIPDTVLVGDGSGFVTKVLQGAGDSYVGAGGPFAGSTLYSTFLDRPAVAVQGGRLSGVRDLAVLGVNRDWIWNHIGNFFGDAATVDASDDAVWRDPAGLGAVAQAFGRYSPYCGIAVDPYAAPAPPVGYHGTYGALPFSSQTRIDNVSITGFEVGFVIQPSGGDGNGDFPSFKEVSFAANRVHVSATHTQGRQWHFDDCNFALGQYLLTTRQHGKQLGGNGFEFYGCGFGGIVHLFDVEPAFAGSVVMHGGYGEQVWRIGYLGNWNQNGQDVVISSSTIRLTDCGPLLGVPATVAQSQGVGALVLKSGMLQVQDISVFDCPLRIDGTKITNTKADAISPSAPLSYKKAQMLTWGVFVRPSWMAYLAAGVNPSTNYYWPNIDSGGPVYGVAGRPIPGGRQAPLPWWANESSYGRPLKPMYYSAPCDVIGVNPDGTGMIRWDGDVYPHQPGDLIFDDQTCTLWFVTATDGLNDQVEPLNNLRGNPPVLRVQPPANLRSLWIVRSGIYSTSVPICGDITQGSTLIQNVPTFPAGEIKAGDFLLPSPGRPQYFAPGARVTSIKNAGAQGMTIVVNQAARRSDRAVPLDMFMRSES